MLAALLAFFGGSSILAAAATALGGGTVLAALLPFVFKNPLLRKVLFLLACALGAAFLTLAALAWHGNKVSAALKRAADTATAIEAGKWQAKYNAALIAWTETRNRQEAELARRERELIAKEDELDATKQQNADALRAALSGGSGDVVFPDSLLEPFRRAGRSHPGD